MMVRFAVAICWLPAVLALVGCNQAPARPASAGSPPADQPKTATKPASTQHEPARFLPWLELSPGPGPLNAAANGLIVWERVTDTVIISIEPGNENTIAHLQRRYPRVKIIPGLKTSPIFGTSGFDSVDSWRLVARRVQELAQLTGSNTVLFEHESAVRSYMVGDCPLNMDDLRKGLRQLRREYLYLWYPGIGESGDRLERLVTLCGVISAECEKVRFVDSAVLHAPRFAGGRGAQQLHDLLKGVSTQPPVPLIYCMNDKDYWPLERLTDALRLVDTDLAIIYPGAVRWEAAARAMAEQRPTYAPGRSRTREP